MNYTRLTLEERYQISSLLESGISIQKIAKKMNRNPGSISRELKRNKGQRGYRPRQAHMKAMERFNSTPKHIKMTSDLIKRINGLIRNKWSPDQISGRLRRENIFISHERIYQHILEDKNNDGDLHTHLRCQKKRRKRYGTKRYDKRGQIKDRVSIEKRPDVVEEKKRVGDWEGDLVIGKNHKSCLVTLADRGTKKTKIGKIKSKQSTEVSQKINSKLKKEVVRTITLDNGKEFSEHKQVADSTKSRVYFAHPYSSWERGLNENTNGLIRQYFPKKTDFSKISGQQVRKVENALNNRPRKILNYLTPNEVYERKACLAKRVYDK